MPQVRSGEKTPRRSPARFLLTFGALLLLFYFAIAIHPVNDRIVVPFTAGVARASAAVLNVLGERVAVSGTTIASRFFSVNIENGCNGLETALLLAAAVLAFPATARQRAVGFFGGFAAIQLLNLVRVVSLFWIGAHRPKWFGSAHALVWQSIVVLAGVALFVLWASRVASRSLRTGAR
jgi:exosortase H (IPTLxxWG-CTERM-specific)